MHYLVYYLLSLWQTFTWKWRQWCFDFYIIANHFNKFAVVSLSWLSLMVMNLLFLHGKVCPTLNFCPHTQFPGNRCKCLPYLILIISVKSCLFNAYPSSISGNEENHIEELSRWITSFSFFWLYFKFQSFSCFKVGRSCFQ